MTTIDPSTTLGKLRLRVADHGDLPYLPDSVYLQAYEDSGNDITSAAKTCAMYILGMLAHKTHRKLNQLETWGAEAFKNYKEFLILTVKDPAFMTLCPIPYSATADSVSAIAQFQADWNKNFYRGTESQQLAINALFSPNDGSTYGFTLDGE